MIYNHPIGNLYRLSWGPETTIDYKYDSFGAQNPDLIWQSLTGWMTYIWSNLIANSPRNGGFSKGNLLFHEISVGEILKIAQI